MIFYQYQADVRLIRERVQVQDPNYEMKIIWKNRHQQAKIPSSNSTFIPSSTLTFIPSSIPISQIPSSRKIDFQMKIDEELTKSSAPEINKYLKIFHRVIKVHVTAVRGSLSIIAEKCTRPSTPRTLQPFYPHGIYPQTTAQTFLDPQSHLDPSPTKNVDKDDEY